MLARIVIESLTRRRRRKLLSVLAVTLGMAVTAAVGTLALDVGDKVGLELRSFGANIAVTPAADGLTVAFGGVDYRPAGAGEFLPEDRLVSLKKIFWRNNIVAFAPFLYVPVKVQGRRTILTGSWLQKTLHVDKSEVFVTGLEKLHPTWKVQGQWPAAGDAVGALVGRRLADQVGAKPGQSLTVEAVSESAGRPALEGNLAVPRPSSEDFVVRGILETGGPEDDSVLAPLEAVQKFAGLEGKVRRVEVSALTKPEDAFARSDITRLSSKDFDRWYCSPYVASIAYQIQQAIPESEAKPVYQVAETEGRILDRVGILMAVLAAAALVTAALAVASMMLATVLERRTEIGLFKALGATNARVAVLFLLEACAVGLVGGGAGYILGSFLAWRLGLSVFGATVGVHWVVFPACVGLALLVSLSGSAVPLGRVLRISPSSVLRD